MAVASTDPLNPPPSPHPAGPQGIVYVAQPPARFLAGRLGVTPAGGSQVTSWRAGFTNVDPGQTFTTLWVQTIPALGSVVGDNLFTLTAEDVTPAPYNQPPYVLSGDTDTAACTVTGITP